MEKLLNIKCRWIVILIFFALIDVSVVYAQDPIVYVRCERTTDPFELTGNVTINGVAKTVTRQMRGLDIYDVLPDVTNFFGNFSAPCDLMHLDAAGNETVLFDCSSFSSSENSCAALDPAVSFDGLSVVFSVFRGRIEPFVKNIHKQVIEPQAEITGGSLDHSSNFVVRTLPNKHLTTEGAHLHLVKISTGEVSFVPFVPGIYESGPTFLTNNRVAFTSNRDGNRTTKVWRTGSTREGTRIWAINIDGSDLDLSSHHSLSQEQHPFLLKDGKLAYSSWQIFGGLPFRHTNGAIGGFSTIDNLFHIYTQAPDGAGNFPLYGQHSGDHTISSFGEDHSAAHFLTQTSDDRVWFADYYRGNNNGLGVVIGVMQEPAGQEGADPMTAITRGDNYIPSDVINFATWAHNRDTLSHHVNPGEGIPHVNYEALYFKGKVGHPAALSSSPGLMLAWGKGTCGTVTKNNIFAAFGRQAPAITTGSGWGAAMNLITSMGVDAPGCDVGLYRATIIPSNHPSDLDLIVDTREWHEIMGRAAVPYSSIYGVAQPQVIERADIIASTDPTVPPGILEAGTPFGLLGAASITDRETHPRDGIHFAGEHQFNSQGTDTINYNHDDLCGVRILGIMPNRGDRAQLEIANVAGERVAILGEFSVLNSDSSGARIRSAKSVDGLDTSFLVRFPANTPYLMQSIDCDGRTLNTDQTWQHLRPGEMKTCGGCHVHSRPTRENFNQTYAATTGYVVPKLGEGHVPLLAGKNGNNVMTRTMPGYGLQVDFTRDILPIFNERCASCHNSDSPAAGLALDRPGTDATTKSAWWCLVADFKQTCVLPGNQTLTGEGSGGTSLRRPQLSRYIRAFNSLGSLLYWKAANERTDGNSDATLGNDIDFGSVHPTEITLEELGLLSRWIDIGAPGGPGELRDTQKPTLHVAMPKGDTSQLRVGTVDLGSGINVESLVVCVVAKGGACINQDNNIPGLTAEKHGVTSVLLGSALSDPMAEVVVRIQDLAGNETEVRRSLNWLLK